MVGLVQELLQREGVQKNPPTDPAVLDALLQYIGKPLPDLLVELWRESDGLELPGIQAKLLVVPSARNCD